MFGMVQKKNCIETAEDKATIKLNCVVKLTFRALSLIIVKHDLIDIIFTWLFLYGCQMAIFAGGSPPNLEGIKCFDLLFCHRHPTFLPSFSKIGN